VSGGTRAAATSEDDPLSASTLSALPPNGTMSEAGMQNVCDDDVVDVQPVGRRCRPCQQRAHGWIKPVVHLVLQLISHSVPYAGTFGNGSNVAVTNKYAFRITTDRRQR
jgi:hypothetical protein